MSSEIKNESIENESIENALVKVISNPDIDLNKLEKYLDLQERVLNKKAEASFYNAMSNFQKECPIIERSKKVDFTSAKGNRVKYEYAPIDEIVHIIKPILSKNGLSYSFDTEYIDETMKMIVTIYHIDGHCKTSSALFPKYHDDQRMTIAQRIKSVMTYAKRCTLENALGIATTGDDDDALRLTDTLASDEEIQQIKLLAKKTKSKEQDILDHFDISSFDTITKYDAKRIISGLKGKAAQITKKLKTKEVKNG